MKTPDYSLLEIVFNRSNGTPYTLLYKIFKNSLHDRWVEQLGLKSNCKITSFFKNSQSNTLPELIVDLNQLIIKINSYYDRAISPIDDTIELQTQLNAAHFEYELYCHRVLELKESNYYALTKNKDSKIWPGETFNLEFHSSFLRLNELIHICESAAACDDKTSSFPSFSCVMDYYPYDTFQDIQEIDKLFLTTDYCWGGLYLGYKTLGKSWLEVSVTNDLNLIMTDSVVTQTQFGPEINLKFCETTVETDVVKVLYYQWYKTLSEDVKKKIPIDNLNKLVLGRFYMGHIVINDSLLKFHPIKNDWYIPNSDCQRRWNLEIFSTFTEVLSIRPI
jgi:hypothetical protein